MVASLGKPFNLSQDCSATVKPHGPTRASHPMLASLPDDVLARIVFFVPRRSHLNLLRVAPFVRSAVLAQRQYGHRSILHAIDLVPFTYASSMPPATSPTSHTTTSLCDRAMLAGLALESLRLHSALAEGCTAALLKTAAQHCPNIKNVAVFDDGHATAPALKELITKSKKLTEFNIARPGPEALSVLGRLPHSVESVFLCDLRAPLLPNLLEALADLSFRGQSDCLMLDVDIICSSQWDANINAARRFVTRLSKSGWQDLQCLEHMTLRMESGLFRRVFKEIFDRMAGSPKHRHRLLPPYTSLSVEAPTSSGAFFRFLPPANQSDCDSQFMMKHGTQRLKALLRLEESGELPLERLANIVTLRVSASSASPRHSGLVKRVADKLSDSAPELRSLSLRCDDNLVSGEWPRLGTELRNLVSCATEVVTRLPSLRKIKLPRQLVARFDDEAVKEFFRAMQHLEFIHLVDHYERVAKHEWCPPCNLEVEGLMLTRVMDVVQLISESLPNLRCLYLERSRAVVSYESSELRATIPKVLEMLDEFERNRPKTDISTVVAQVEAWIS